jgi:site-specific DNA-methyltransferase (adenine-specific)
VPARFIVGDVRRALCGLPDASVDLLFTSPPFLGLRDYLPDDDPAKPLEIGGEESPGEFLDALLDVVELAAPKLAPHASLCVELGDTYAGSGGAGGDYYNEAGLRAGQPKPRGSRSGCDWPEARSLCLIPQAFALALAYGRNPLTGRATERWRVRNLVVWCRPNPPVGELGDKFRPATSFIVCACRDRRFFDLYGVRSINDAERMEDNVGRSSARDKARADVGLSSGASAMGADHPLGAPPKDWWCIPGASYPGAHYAVMNPEVVVLPVKAMSPERVFSVCGRPLERVRHDHGSDFVECCGPWRPGLVLDPFAGTGTTLLVATGHGRDAIGIDLDARNAELARERLGMFYEEG